MIDTNKVVSGINYNGTPLTLAGGGGSNVATGTFTMTSQRSYLPTITHNLNSQKIVLIVWDTRSEFTATVAYQLHHMIWCNYPAITGQTSVVADFSAYNANQSAPVTWDFTSQTENNSVGAYIRSAYTSTTDAKIQNGLNDSTFCGLVNFDGWGTSSQHEITNNELKNIMCGNKNSMGALVPNVEYRWIAIKCE